METPHGISIFNVIEKWNGISTEWIACNFHQFHWQCDHSNGTWKFHAFHSREFSFHRSGHNENGISTPVEFPFHYAIKIFWSAMHVLACAMPKFIKYKYLWNCFIIFLFLFVMRFCDIVTELINFHPWPSMKTFFGLHTLLPFSIAPFEFCVKYWRQNIFAEGAVEWQNRMINFV